jgi:hypothetical protein
MARLLHCYDCGDLVKVVGRAPGRRCRCRKSRAGWLDAGTIAISGPSRILGVPNEDLVDAKPKADGRGPVYRWYWLPEGPQIVRVSQEAQGDPEAA